MAYAGNAHNARQELAQLVDTIRGQNGSYLSWVMYALGVVTRLDGNYREALNAQHTALALMRESQTAELEHMHGMAELGLNYLALGQDERAKSFLQRSSDLFRKLEREVTPAHREVLHALAHCEERRGSKL
jgi:hypothetical protein